MKKSINAVLATHANTATAERNSPAQRLMAAQQLRNMLKQQQKQQKGK